MQDDSYYETLKKLYDNRNTKDSKDFSTLSDTNQEEIYGQILREIDTHETEED